MKNNYKKELDFIDILFLFNKNKIIIFVFLIISVLIFALYNYVLKKNNYLSIIEISTNNDLFLLQSSTINLSNESLNEKFIYEFYNIYNYESWSKNIENLKFSKSDFFGSSGEDEYFYTSSRDGRMYKFTINENLINLNISSNNKIKINQILQYSYYINKLVTKDLYDSFSEILLGYFDESKNSGNIENQTTYQLMMSKIKNDKVYRISNPSLPTTDSESPIKIIILFIFVGLFLSFIFILIRYFYNLKLIDKKYK